MRHFVTRVGGRAAERYITPKKIIYNLMYNIYYVFIITYMFYLYIFIQSCIVINMYTQTLL